MTHAARISRRTLLALLLSGCAAGECEPMKCGAIGLLGFGSGQTWFVDSVGGDDGNTGHSAAQAFETLGKLVSEVALEGDTVMLARGSRWREALTGLPARTTLRAYGAGARPIIDGSDVALNASFSKTVGRTNIWQIAWSHNFTAAGGKTAHRVWINGVRMRRIAVDTEVLATALTALDAQPGAFFAAPPTSGGPDTVYVHSTGSTDPTVDGKTYELSARADCLRLDFEDNARVYSLQLQRNAHADGSLVIDGYAEDCHMIDGRVHNCLWRGELVNCVAQNMEPPAVIGGATMFVSHHDNNSSWQNGKDSIARGCQALAEAGVFGPAGATNIGSTIGFYGHVTGGFSFRTAYYEECKAQNVQVAFAFDNLVNAVYYKCETIEGVRYAISNTAMNLLVLGGTLFVESIDSQALHIEDDVSLPDNVIMRGVRVYKQDGGLGPIVCNTDGTTFSITRCTLATDGAGGLNSLLDGTFTYSHNIMHCPNNLVMVRLGTTGEPAPGYTADSNVYWNAGISGATFQTGTSPPVDHLTIAAWRTATGQEAQSVAADPLFHGSPAAGDFTVQAGSPANALQAGADYEGEDNDAVLQALLAQYTAGLQT